MLNIQNHYELQFLSLKAQLSLICLSNEFVDEIIDWCNNNCEDDWSISDSTSSIKFRSKNDYVLAKLYWMEDITTILKTSG